MKHFIQLSVLWSLLALSLSNDLRVSDLSNVNSEIDLVFVIDETGSMGSEIDAVKKNVLEILSTIESLPNCKKLRYGLIGYRDHCDPWVVDVRVPLTDDIEQMKKAVKGMHPGGGGDYAEAMTDALHRLARLDWRPNAVKTAILIADAPPHGVGSSGDHHPEGCPCGEDWMEQVESCREQGIIIHTLGCRAMEDSDVLRKISKTTWGHYFPLDGAALLPKFVVGLADVDLRKVQLRSSILELLNQYSSPLHALSEKDGIEMILGFARSSKLQSPSLDLKSMALEFRDIMKSDVIEAISGIRRLKLFPQLDEIFPKAGVSSRPPIESGVFSQGSTESAVGVPLQYVLIDVTIRDIFSEVVIEQVYENLLNTTLDLTYKFPIDETAAVVNFTAEIDGKVIIAQCMEKQQARKVYEEAVASKRGGYLLEQKSADVFEISLGNLPPGKQAKLQITYVATLEHEDEFLRFSIPTTVAPRSTGSTRSVDQKKAEEAREKSSHEYAMRIYVDIESKSDIMSIESPSHPEVLAPTVDGRKGRVTLRGESFLDSDFVLLIREQTAKTAKTSGVLVETWPINPSQFPVISWDNIQPSDPIEILVQNITFRTPFDVSQILLKFTNQKIGITTVADLLALKAQDIYDIGLPLILKRKVLDFIEEKKAPRLHKPSPNRFDNFQPHQAAIFTFQPNYEMDYLDPNTDIILALDLSQSMVGGQLNLLQAGLSYFASSLSKLPSQTQFNVILFGTETKRVFPRMMSVHDRNAVATIEQLSLQANMGGTQLKSALVDIVKLCQQSARSTSILLLTDGEISATKNIESYLKKEMLFRAKLRIFPVGIGYSVSHGNIRMLARLGKGIPSFCLPTEDITQRISDQFHRIFSSLTNMNLVWNINGSAQNPQQFLVPNFSPIKSGDVISVYTFLNQTSSGTLTLKGDHPNPKKAFSQTIYFSTDPKGLFMREGKMIHRLTAFNYLNQLINDNQLNPYLKEEVISLATHFNLASPYTSFVAVNTYTPEEEKMIDLDDKITVEIESSPKREASASASYYTASVPVKSAPYSGTGPSSAAYGHSGSSTGSSASTSDDTDDDDEDYSGHVNDPYSHTKDLLLLDVIPLSYGVGVCGGLVIPLIQRNSVIPTKKSKTFTTSYPYQTAVNLEIYAGEYSNQNASCLLGNFTLDVPSARYVEIEVTLEIDANGIETVTASVKHTGQLFELKLPQKRYSQEEIEELIVGAEITAAEDDKQPQQILQRLKLEEYIRLVEYDFSISTTLSTSPSQCSLVKPIVGSWNRIDGTKFSRDDEKKIESILEEVREWLITSPNATYQELEDKLIELQDLLLPLFRTHFPDFVIAKVEPDPYAGYDYDTDVDL